MVIGKTTLAVEVANKLEKSLERIEGQLEIRSNASGIGRMI